jgi:hypothetical protein
MNQNGVNPDQMLVYLQQNCAHTVARLLVDLSYAHARIDELMGRIAELERERAGT